MRVAIECLGQASNYSVARWIAEYLGYPVVHNFNEASYYSNAVLIGHNMPRCIFDEADKSICLYNGWQGKPTNVFGELFDADKHDVVRDASLYIKGGV